MEPESTFIGRRYRLHEQLGAGGMGAVYHATDRLTGHSVALKRVTAPTTELTFASKADGSTNLRMALAGEFRTLASLRHPHIISVLDYGFDDTHQPYFTMELLPQAQTIFEAGKGKSTPEKIDLILQILQAIVYLHRRGILHRDLKPGNVLVGDGRVKVVDFGLSVATNTDSARHHTQTAAGTFAYMAPELFAGAPISRASDLYAVGLIAYELFAGRHPFNVNNIALLINDILNKPADVWSLGLSENLAAVLERLLEKSAEARYEDASSVIHALCTAADIPLPPETSAIRESFLQAARFVGRESEIEQITNALNLAQHRQGSAWLVGGESGVGKSRFLDEVRTLALVKGMLVLRGQAVNQGSRPYQLWHEVLRWLALFTDLRDEEAGILKTLIPDIGELLGREIPDASPLDPQPAQNRLIAAITDLFGRQEQPIMLLLEDLQWAGSESLLVLERLSRSLSKSPLLLIGSYRDDEYPDLPKNLTGMRPLKLSRLNEVSIAELSGAMLGSAGREARVIDFLQRQTEGNAFFVVEVVRTLAEQSGRLDEIAMMTLPEKLVAGGIREVVQRRLEQVSDDARPLLRLAAIIGREVDSAVLHELDTAANFEQWTLTCTNAAILEAQEKRWRFAHDKLREGVLADIAEDQLPTLHRQVAAAMETLYGEAPERAAALGYHFQQAGIADKAVQYLTRAGDHARANYANGEAISFYRQAIHQANEIQGSVSDLWQHLMAQTHESLGDILELTGQHEEARQVYQQVLTQASPDDMLWQARLQRKIGKTLEMQRLYDQAVQLYLQAEAIQGDIPSEPHAEWWTEWVQIRVDRIQTYYWMNRQQEMNELADNVQSAVEQYGNPDQRSKFFVSLLLLDVRRYRYANLPDEAVSHGQSAVAAVAETQFLGQYAWSQFCLGFVHLWRNELDEAEKHITTGAELAQRIGDVTTLTRCLSYLAIIYRKRQDIPKVRDFAARGLAAASVGQMNEYIAMANANQAWAERREGNLDEAYEVGLAAHQMFQQVPQGKMTPWVTAYPLVGIYLARNQIGEAIELVRPMLNPASQPMPADQIDLLQGAVQAWDEQRADDSRLLLTQAADIAQQAGYL